MKPLFDKSDWNRITNDYCAWWERRIDRPLFNLSFYGCEPDMKRPAGMITENLHEMAGDPPEMVAEKYDYIMRTRRYAADGYPGYWFNLGPIFGVEFYGARAFVTPDTTWYKPDIFEPIERLCPAISADSVFLPRIRELYRAFNERFGGSVAASSPPRFCFDYLCSFLSSSDMAYALYDSPQEVKRCLREFMDVDIPLREELYGYIKDAPGFTTWGGIFAPEAWDSTQCDYSALISPEHFREFVLPVLERSINHSPRYNYYHLDGPGELCHLDMILGIENLKCMQWVPSPNDRDQCKWGWLFREIADAGKNIWFCGGLDNLDLLIDQIGTTKGLYLTASYHISEYDNVMRRIEKYI
ncbi:MAG: hypothetical protein PHZ09_07850 [Eubacteriales bacterium]|nr:hypothetical protein [Eubacteriales bacterium]